MYTVYILKCRDNTLYTGITTDITRRIAEHQAGTASKYTRAKGFAALLYTETHPDRASASTREYTIKQLTRRQKETLIHNTADFR